MNRKNDSINKPHVNGYKVGGKRLIEEYSSGVRIYRDREITLRHSKSKRKLGISENQLREAFEDTEKYLHTLEQPNSLEELKNRVEAGLRLHPFLKASKIEADNLLWLLEDLYKGETQDLRPEELRNPEL